MPLHLLAKNIRQTGELRTAPRGIVVKLKNGHGVEFHVGRYGQGLC